MKVQLKQAQTKPTTIRLKPGDVALVMKQEKGKSPLKAHCFYSQLLKETETEEVNIQLDLGKDDKNKGISSTVYRVSDWR